LKWSEVKAYLDGNFVTSLYNKDAEDPQRVVHVMEKRLKEINKFIKDTVNLRNSGFVDGSK
jgi:hypothetical protein